MTSRFVMRFLPVALVVLAAGLGTQARAGNIVLDGGFETAAVDCASSGYTGSVGDGWTATQGTIQVCVGGPGTGVPHSGVHLVYLDFELSQNTLSQTLTTVVGQSYLVSFWVGDTAANALSVDFGSQVLFNGTAPTNGVSPASDYVNDTYTVTATSTSTILSFTGQYTTGNGTVLDDVSVTAVSTGVPEPATFGFTAAGFLALLVLRGIYDRLQVDSKAEAVAKLPRNRLV
jgi:hypothetical protein